MSNDPIDGLPKATEALGALIKAAGDNPEARDAGRELGSAALIVSKTIKNALLPLAAINFAVDKAREYFQKVFPGEMETKAKKIPPDAIVAPKASIAGPALQGLAFSHEELDLREMYLSLLANAMDSRRSAQAHPAFVEIIRQLTSEEARLLKSLSKQPLLPIVQIALRLPNKPGSEVVLHRCVLPVFENGAPTVQPNASAIVDNWVRLGLFRADFLRSLTDNESYAWVDNWPECVEINKNFSGGKISFRRGILERTDFGTQFIFAVGAFELPGVGIVPPSGDSRDDPGSGDQMEHAK